MASLKTTKKDLSSVLKSPRITEKGAVISGLNNVYPFNISVDANKKDVIDAIKLIYKVTPVKVAVVTIRSKTVVSRRNGKKGTKSGGKKAYVYLKKGDKIEFV
jgi:large subunit ribosomal protein L23